MIPNHVALFDFLWSEYRGRRDLRDIPALQKVWRKACLNNGVVNGRIGVCDTDYFLLHNKNCERLK